MNIPKNLVAITLPLLLVLFAVWYLAQQPTTQNITPSPTPTAAVQTTDRVSYQGKNGIDALTLLKETAQVEQDNSGLVVSINGRKTDSGAREYWAFYVNGALAPVGPRDYQTKDSDQIEWKIEKY